MEILDEKDGVDTELLVYAMTLINKVSKEYHLGLSTRSSLGLYLSNPIWVSYLQCF